MSRRTGAFERGIVCVCLYVYVLVPNSCIKSNMTRTHRCHSRKLRETLKVEHVDLSG